MKVNLTNWKDTADLIGMAAIVASLIFVGLQLHQDRELATAQWYMEGSTSYIEMSQLITDNESVWIKGLNGEELPLEDRAKFDQIARSWHLRKLNVYYASQWTDFNDQEQWGRSTAYDLYKHPGLRRWFTKFRADFAPRRSERGRQTIHTNFSDLVEIKLAEFDAESPPIPDDKTYMLP